MDGTAPFLVVEVHRPASSLLLLSALGSSIGRPGVLRIGACLSACSTISRRTRESSAPHHLAIQSRNRQSQPTNQKGKKEQVFH